jgi:hypothetical protein
MPKEKAKPECSTDLDVYRDLGPKQGEELARSRVMSAHQVLMGERAKARDARENELAKKADEKKK